MCKHLSTVRYSKTNKENDLNEIAIVYHSYFILIPSKCIMHMVFKPPPPTLVLCLIFGSLLEYTTTTHNTQQICHTNAYAIS